MSYVCETCGKEYKTRSGLWKHQKKLGHGKYASDMLFGSGDAGEKIAESISSIKLDVVKRFID